MVSALAVVLSGCLRYQVDLSVSADQRVSGTVIFAVRTTASNVVRANTEIPPDLVDRVTLRPYEQDGYLGERLTLDRLTFDQAGRLFDQVGVLFDRANRSRSRPTASATPGLATTPGATVPPSSPPVSAPASGTEPGTGRENQSTLTFTRDGDLLRVSGLTSFPLFASDGADRGFDARITLTFPGDIVSTNGVRHDRTVSWVVSPDRPTQISVVTRLSDAAPVWVTWVLAGGGGLLVVLAALLATTLVRRRRAAVPAGAAPVFDAAEFQTFIDDRSWYPPAAPAGPVDPGGAGGAAFGNPQPPPPPPPYAGPGQPDAGQFGHPGQQGQPPQQGQPGGPGRGEAGWPPPYPETPHR